MAVILDRVVFSSVTVTDRTEWTFAEIVDSRGEGALVEITRGVHTPRVVTLLAESIDTLRGQPIDDEAVLATSLSLTLAEFQADPDLATALSALRTAVVELQAKESGLSVAQLLGGPPVESVELYANINRGLFAGGRTTSEFAAAAERTVGEGFATVKCAPFDEVRPSMSTTDIAAAARPGIERVAAVRRAVGAGVQVLVDCHSRFTASSAVRVADELRKLNVGWFEEPLQPMRDARDLASIAGAVAMPIAGGESGYGEEFFAGLLEGGTVSIIMPDVKYCGGVAEAFKAGTDAVRAGQGVSLHSPSGPVSSLAGAHVTAATTGAMPLEYAVHEASWRAELLVPGERVADGRMWLPGAPGLGVSLDIATVLRHGRRWEP